MRTSESSRRLLTRRSAGAAIGGDDGRTLASPGRARGAWTPSRRRSFPRRPCGTSGASTRAATPLRPPGLCSPLGTARRSSSSRSSGSMKFACLMAGRTRVTSCVLYEHLQSDIVGANPPNEVTEPPVSHGGSIDGREDPARRGQRDEPRHALAPPPASGLRGGHGRRRRERSGPDQVGDACPRSSWT